MKKVAAGILLLVYLTVSTGVVVSVHWCMNRVDSVELGHSDQKECGKCGMPMADNSGCCKDDVQFLKMKADHALAKILVPDFSFAPLLTEHFSQQFFTSAVAVREQFPLAHGPPLSRQDTYLKNRVFRI